MGSLAFSLYLTQLIKTLFLLFVSFGSRVELMTGKIFLNILVIQVALWLFKINSQYCLRMCCCFLVALSFLTNPEMFFCGRNVALPSCSFRGLSSSRGWYTDFVEFPVYGRKLKISSFFPFHFGIVPLSFSKPN